jgi:hypothetical protein
MKVLCSCFLPVSYIMRIHRLAAKNRTHQFMSIPLLSQLELLKQLWRLVTLIPVGDVMQSTGVPHSAAVPSLDSLKPWLLEQEAKTSMVEIHQGANAGKVEAPWVESSVGCLDSHGHGLGRPIQVVDGNILPGIISSVDALARERLDVDMARGMGFLVFPCLDVQKNTYDVQYITFGHGGNPRARIGRRW